MINFLVEWTKTERGIKAIREKLLIQVKDEELAIKYAQQYCSKKLKTAYDFKAYNLDEMLEKRGLKIVAIKEEQPNNDKEETNKEKKTTKDDKNIETKGQNALDM